MRLLRGEEAPTLGLRVLGEEEPSSNPTWYAAVSISFNFRTNASGMVKPLFKLFVGDRLCAGSVEESEYIDWPTRFKIATQTARGLQYLHDELQPQIIHGDIKASNVLLNSNLDAKISDFGLGKLCPDDKTNFTTNLAGTM